MSPSETLSLPEQSRILELELAGEGWSLPSLAASINEFCDRVEEAGDDGIAVIHLGDAYHGGAQPDTENITIHMVNRWERALRRVERLNVVTIGTARGNCGAYALEVLLAVDYRIAAKDLRLAMPASSGQFWPGMAIHRLANQIGLIRARRLLLHRTEITATSAAKLDLVDEIVDGVAGHVRNLMTKLRAVDGAEFAIRRRLLLDAPTTSFEDALGVHLAACDRALRKAERDRDPDPVVLSG